MSELTLTLIKLGFLALLWMFVLAVLSVIRSDLFGAKVDSRISQAAAVPQNSRTPSPRCCDARVRHRRVRRSRATGSSRQAYFAMFSVVRPIRIEPPISAGTGRVTRWPSRYVPLVEPRSSTHHWPSDRNNRECRVDE